MAVNLEYELCRNSYPGRGIIIGRSDDNKKAVIVYFIMGRSANSRNRIFVESEDGIRTEAYDISKVEDPSLIIYSPVRTIDGKTIVTNGDQTDTIYDSLSSGHCFIHALRQREFEPDAPNYTPRISGVVLPNGDYKLSILKSANGNPSSCRRYFFEYSNTPAGTGHFIHTYSGDGNPLPSFEGEPKEVEISGSINELASKVWESLNEDNKISLFVRYIDIASGKTESLIINKNK